VERRIIVLSEERLDGLLATESAPFMTGDGIFSQTVLLEKMNHIADGAAVRHRNNPFTARIDRSDLCQPSHFRELFDGTIWRTSARLADDATRGKGFRVKEIRDCPENWGSLVLTSVEIGSRP
jgi:hypothetical protein